MSKQATIIRLEAKPEYAKRLEELLKSKISQIKNEQGIPSCYVLKFSEVCFSVFASFSEESASQAHQKSELLNSIFAISDDWLVKQPLLIPVDLVASKIGDEIEIAPAVAVGTKKYNLRFVDGL